MASNGTVIEFFPRKYLKDPVTGGLTFDEKGYITNPVVWEDPNIAEGRNKNVVLDLGGETVLYNIFGLAGSAVFQFMAYGASATAAAHTQSQLVYELIADATRPKLTNTDGSPLSASCVTLTTYNDTSYSPTYSYYRQAAVLGSIAAGTANVNQPVSEIAINTALACPGTNTGSSGIYLDRYVFGSPTVLDGATILAITILLHF